MIEHVRVYQIKGHNLFLRYKFATYESALDFARNELKLKDDQFYIDSFYI